MSILQEDAFSRRIGRRQTGRRRGRPSYSVALFVFASIALLLLSRADHPWLGQVRSITDRVVAPVYEATSMPAIYLQRARKQLASYIVLFEELERLKLENQQLKQWQWRAQQLEAEIDRYRGLLKSAQETGFGFATGRVVAEGRSPFVRSLLVNIGSRAGVKSGYAVVNRDGFVGRSIEVSESATRVLLASDPSSRIPVLIGSARLRGILRGDSSADPVIEFIGDPDAVRDGDEVTTSGHDGVLPAGLRIGSAGRRDGSLRVKLHANLSTLDFVSILFFEAPGLPLVGEPSTSERRRVAVDAE